MTIYHLVSDVRVILQHGHNVINKPSHKLFSDLFPRARGVSIYFLSFPGHMQLFPAGRREIIPAGSPEIILTFQGFQN